MRADETILFSDLDGTLFDSRGRISRENRAAIERYMAAGGRFAFSTGRAPVNAKRFLGGLPTNAPSVVYNGAGVYDFSDGTYQFLLHLDKGEVFPILRWALENIPGLDLQIYTDDEILYCTPEAAAQKDFLEIHRPVRFVTLDELTAADAPVVKSLLLSEESLLPRMGEYLEPRAAGRYDLTLGTVMLGGNYLRYYEAMPPGATKGSALHALRSHPSTAGRTILAAGDYWNDFDLLREADVPVCPANAIDEIKALCRFVTVSNDESAIAKIIDEVIPSL